MHQNSLNAFLELKPRPREMEIFKVYARSRRPLSDREIRDRGGWSDMNDVRPRITRMIEIGVAFEVFSDRCRITGKMVRHTQLKKKFKRGVK